MKGIDTNVLIRYLVQDDPKQSKMATSFIEKHCSHEAPGFIGHIVLCELVWVLEGNYGQSREQIADILEKLLQTAELEVMESEQAWRALRDYRVSKVDFSDHLLARMNTAYGCEETVTFDKQAGKQAIFSLL